MRDGHPIRFAGEGSQHPGTLAGDIVIVIDEQDHPVFKRKGDHLVLNLNLSLRESLCGTVRYVETLEVIEGQKRFLKIDILPGEVLKQVCSYSEKSSIHLVIQGDIRVLPSEGMPMHKNPQEKGNLIVMVDVKFPAKLTEETIKELAALLPRTTAEPMIPDDADHYDCIVAQPRPKRQQSQRAGGGGHPFLLVFSIILSYS